MIQYLKSWRHWLCTKNALRKPLNKISENIPDLITFLCLEFSLPVSEAVCESWKSVISNVRHLRTWNTDRSNSDVKVVDIRVFFILNGCVLITKNI